MQKKILALVLALAMALGMTACGQSVGGDTAASTAGSAAASTAGSAAETEGAMKVGFVYIGDESEAYTANFIAAENAIKEQFGDKNFPCLAYAVEAAERGGTACAVLTGANEAAVGMFLKDEIGFNDIPRRVRRAMNQVPVVERPTLEDILAADRQARECVEKW